MLTFATRSRRGRWLLSVLTLMLVAASTPAPSAAHAADPHPLYLSISIHVEGHFEAVFDQATFEKHRDGILDISETAAEHGAIVSFEISPVFVDAIVKWNDPVLTQLLDDGHALGVHADIGGVGEPTRKELTKELKAQKAALEAVAGVEITHLSGICSAGKWIEAAKRAGFRTITGVVAYCMTSLDDEYLSDESAFVADCESPADCHGPPVLGKGKRIHPFYVNSSHDWVKDKKAAKKKKRDKSVILIVSEGGSSIDCLTETDPSCIPTPADALVAAAAVDEYLGDYKPKKVGVLSWSWSVGRIPPGAFNDVLFSMLNDAIADADVVWASPEDINDIKRG